MRIAILSDIHDNVWKLAAALPGMRAAEVMLCCGDLCSPFIVDQLAAGFPGPIHIIFGNNDGDLFRIAGNAGKYGGRVQLHGAFYAAVLDGARLAANHYPDIARAIAASGAYDVVCYGHDHAFHVDPPGPYRTLNPGAIMGFSPAHGSDVPSTFLLYDTADGGVSGYQVIAAGGGAAAAEIVAYP